jgi:RNA polymerase sigma-70 factor, ECF subfamily
VPYADLGDEALVIAYRQAPAANREAIAEELFGRYFERVARWCFRFTGDRDAAADLAQDVFLKAHRYIDTFKGTAQFSTWLYSIARHESLNRLRRVGPRIEGDDVLEDVAALEPGPEELVSRRTRSDRLHEFLGSSLDRVERTVFVLHYGDDMPLDRITRLLGLTNASGAKAYIVSARRKLARATARVRARGEEL